MRGGTDKVTFGFSANHFRNDGFSKRDTNKESDGSDITHVRGNLGLDVTDNLSVSFNGGYELAEFELDDGFSSSLWGEADKEVYYGQVQGTLYAFDDRFKSNLFYRVSHTDRDSNTPGFLSQFLSTTQTVGYQGDVELLERDVFTFGVDHRHEKTWNNDNFGTDNTFSVNNTAYFINYVKGIGNDITLTLGGRIDDHEQFGTEGTYRSTVAYNLPETDTKFHGSYGTGFKAPSTYQLFDPFYGNDTLQAEETKGWDIGVTQSFLNDRITADATYFKTDFDNLIGFTTRYENVGKAAIEGVETSVDIQATDNLGFFGNYTFTNSEDKDTGLSLLRRPKHMFNIGTDIQYNQFTVNLLGRFIGVQKDTASKKNTSFFTADAKVNYAVNDQVSLYVRVDNILDQDYQEVLTYNAPTVSAYGGIRITY